MAKHGVLEHQLASEPNGVHRDGCELACLPAGRQLRPQPLSMELDRKAMASYTRAVITAERELDS